MLKLQDIHAYYGKSHVLHGVSFEVGKGEIVALLGRNGSGRSTTAKAIMGLVHAEGGLHWKGQDILRKKAYEVAHLGIGYVPENRDIFPKLTVQQNLLLGQKGAGKGSRWSFDDMYAMFPREGLAPKIVELVGEYLKRLKDRGISVLLIEQKLTIAMHISDRALVMGHGTIVFDGTPDFLRADASTRKEWLEV
jgi:branched-chain amino acid transport system ATP-binding protein